VGRGVLEIQTYWSASVTGGHFTSSWRRVRAETDFVSFAMPVEFKYGLAPNLEIRLTPLYLHNWAHQPRSGPGESRSAAFGGLGDLQLGFKYLLVKESDTRPNIGLQGAVTFPTGHHRHLHPNNLGTDQLGDGAYAFFLGLNFSKYVHPFIFYANLRYAMSTKATVAGGPVRARDRVTVNLAAEYPLSKRWVALLEVYSRWDTGPLLGPGATCPPGALIGFLPGIEFLPSPKWELEMGVAIDLFGKNRDITYTPTFTLIHKF
jgi:hypothetical protein